MISNPLFNKLKLLKLQEVCFTDILLFFFSVSFKSLTAKVL